MVADGADFGSGGADHDVAAVAAFPHLDFALCEDFFHLNVLQQGAVAFLMSFLDGCDAAELSRKFGESFLIGGLREAVVHVGPFVVFTGCRCRKVLRSRADAAGQFLVPELRMFLLVVRRLQEDLGDLLKAVFFRFRCEPGVFVARFGLAGERSHQVLFGLCSGIFVCHFNFLLDSFFHCTRTFRSCKETGAAFCQFQALPANS